MPFLTSLADDAFNASSSESSQYSASSSRLQSSSSWMPHESELHIADTQHLLNGGLSFAEQSPWIQVEFQRVHQLHHVVTRGSPTIEAWVTSYRVRSLVSCRSQACHSRDIIIYKTAEKQCVNRTSFEMSNFALPFKGFHEQRSNVTYILNRLYDLSLRRFRTV